MRSTHCWLLAFGLLLVLGIVPAQERGDKAPKDAKDAKDAKIEGDTNAVEVRFADGSIVKMVLLTPHIEIATRYGKLKVAADEIRRIEFGLRVPEETLKRLDAAISGLASPEFPKREAAGKELLALKEVAYPALLIAVKSTDLEVARRAQEVLKTLTERVPAERLRPKKHDTIITPEFPIVGQIETAPLKARTPYFGEVQLQLAELRALRWLGSERETKVVVDAGKHGGPQEAWLDTGIDVAADVGLDITASGNVDLRPMPGEAGQHVSGPAGLQGVGAVAVRAGGGAGGFGGGIAGGIGPGNGGRGAIALRQLPGALIGRIGDNGRIFLVGSKFGGVAPEEGRLFLRIAPNPWGNESTGSYDVRVSVGGNR